MKKLSKYFMLFLLGSTLVFATGCASNKKTMRGKAPRGKKIPCPIKDC